MSTDAALLGSLTLADDQALTGARQKLKKILILGGVDKFEIARTVNAVSEVVRRCAQPVTKETPVKIDVSLAPEESACLLKLSVWPGKKGPERLLSRYFEISEDQQKLQFRRSIPLAKTGEDLQDQMIQILAERSEEEVKQLLIEKEAAEAGQIAQFQFIRKISHELRTPLNVIKGYGEMLMEDTREDQTRADLVHILKASDQLLNIIDNVLHFSKSEMGDMEVAEESVPTGMLVDEIVRDLTPLFERDGNTFTLVCAEHLPSLTTDKDKLEYILSHLLTNASKFTQSGQITFRAFEEKDNDVVGIKLVVEDTGQGITELDQTRLFQPFNQSEPVGSGDGGLGIGLALCCRYSKVLGSSLNVESAPGEGTIFTLWLPLSADTP